MSTVESAWPRFPDYRIDLVPLPFTGEVHQGEVLLARSDRCLLVKETKHADRLYFPSDDVRWDLFEPTQSHSVCPFKGEADYWSLTGTARPEDDVVWTYRSPFPEVAGIAGHVCFYDDRLEVTVAERWPDGSLVQTGFPVWGDQSELLRLVDVEPVDAHTYIAPAYGYNRRNVVEAGQLMAASIVAATKAAPERCVTSASMVFSRAASFAAPVEFDTEILRSGRSFTTVEVRARQDSLLRAAGILLLDAGAPPAVRHHAEMPDVPGPEQATSVDFAVRGRELRAVDDAYDRAPEAVGPPEVHVWVRYRESPASAGLRAALLAQPTTHWSIAAAMRPHAGVGLSQAHVTLTTGVMQATMAFHEDVDLTQWLLYTNTAIWAGHGLTQGEGRIFSESGDLVASYSVQSMLRPLDAPGDPAALNPRTTL